MPPARTKRNSDAQPIRFLPDGEAALEGKSGPGARTCRDLSVEELTSLRHAASLVNAPLSAVLLATFATLLGRLMRQDSFAIRVGVVERAYFRLDGDCSFSKVIEQGSERPANPDFPSERQAINYEFLADDAGFQSEEVQGLRLSVKNNGSQLELASASGLWQRETLETWLGYLPRLATLACGHCALPVKRIPMWSDADARRFYRGLNQTEVAFPGPATVVGHFAEQVRHHPDTPAVHSGTRRYTYRELDHRSTEIARQLVAAGAGPDRAIAVCMSRSVDLLAALLAVLKSGSFYVPLDPHNPPQRLRGILEECRPVAILSDTRSAESLDGTVMMDGVPLLLVDQPVPDVGALPALPAEIDPASLAYTIYTSGTTGKPKGVRITRRSLLNVVQSIRLAPGFEGSDRMLAVAPISFDIASLDMFLPICAGGMLVIASREEAVFPFRLARLLKEHDVTVMQATPATWRMMVSTGWKGKPNLKILSGGEALPFELANSLLRLGGELWNCYGPTETTIWSGLNRIREPAKVVPVGPPIANTSFYVMDEAGNPLPPGVPGELYIGGAGVSPGYVDRPELNAERFVPDTFAAKPGGSLFRTGDLVRMLANHELQFFGRLDFQVKLRGFRIELGEIESVFRSHPQISDVVTVLREDQPGDPKLVAYVVCKGDGLGQPGLDGPAGLDKDELRTYAAGFLPDYMLPSRIVCLDRLPLSTAGKIDRRALPVPDSVPECASAPAAQPAHQPSESKSWIRKAFRKAI